MEEEKVVTNESTEQEKEVDLKELAGKLNDDEKLEVANQLIPQDTMTKYKKAKDVLNQQEYKDAVKDEKECSKVIKHVLCGLGVVKASIHDVGLAITFQDKSTVDEDKLAALLAERGLDNAIITIKKPDPDKLPQLLADGLITEKDLMDCTVPNFIPVLKMDKPKKQKDAGITADVLNKVTGRQGMF
jgi:hypothetical protein